PFAKIVTKAPKFASGQIPIRRPRGAKPHSPHPRRQHRRPGPAIITPGQKPSPGRPPARRTGDPESSHSLTGATDGSAPLQDIQSQGATSPNRIFSLTACVDHERPGRQYRFNLLEQEESFLATRHQGSRARVHDRDALSTSA